MDFRIPNLQEIEKASDRINQDKDSRTLAFDSITNQVRKVVDSGLADSQDVAIGIMIGLQIAVDRFTKVEVSSPHTFDKYKE